MKAAVQQEVSSLLVTIESQQSRILVLETSNDKKTKEISRLTTQLEQQSSSIQSLKNNYNDLEQYSRRNCIRLFGIPEKKGEDAMETICEIAKEKLGVTLPKSAIDRAHRVGQPHNERTNSKNEEEKGNGDRAPGVNETSSHYREAGLIPNKENDHLTKTQVERHRHLDPRGFNKTESKTTCWHAKAQKSTLSVDHWWTNSRSHTCHWRQNNHKKESETTTISEQYKRYFL